MIQYVAMAAAWLASKIEEAGVRLKDLIPVFQRVDAKRSGRKAPPLDPTSDVRLSGGFLVVFARRNYVII